MIGVARTFPAITAALTCVLTASAQQPPRHIERVDVARIIVDARVVGESGNAVLGLGADDFKVKIDGKPVRVESALWVGAADPEFVQPQGATDTEPRVTSHEPRAASGEARATSRDEEPLGRFIVFLFQKSMESSRIVGLLRMLIETRGFLDGLTPNDRVAILSFDTHLKIWSDFTNDRERLRGIVRHDLVHERPPPLQPASRFSLIERLSPGKSRRTYSIEKGLELLGEALEPLPGAKSIVLVGYGFGRLGRMGVSMENGYEPARRALLAARASVFSLDFVDADYHSLEAGLRIISEDTGGFFVRTSVFPALAMRQLAGALAGYYVLFVEKPDSTRRTHEIDVQLTRRKGTVLARSGYEG